MTQTRQLNIVGLGVSVPAHVTREALDVLAASDRMFTVVQEPPDMWLPPSKSPSSVTNLMDLYVEGAFRADNYQRVSQRIWDALDESVAVAYVTYGNPLAYDSVAQRLAVDAEQHGVNLRVVPGISSVDTLLCDLRTDMAPGLQVYEASWLVAARVVLNVSVPAMLVQLGAFGTLRAQYRQPPGSEVLKPLEEYLSHMYSPSHQVSLVRSGNQYSAARIRRVALGELSRVESDDFLGASMFLPALHVPNLDPALLDRESKNKPSSSI